MTWPLRCSAVLPADLVLTASIRATMDAVTRTAVGTEEVPPSRPVRVVGPGGEDLGLMTMPEALARAREADLDLIEVDGLSDPIVCQILDYGKLKYEVELQRRRVLQEARRILRAGSTEPGAKPPRRRDDRDKR